MWNYVATDEMHFFTVMDILQKENLKWLLDHKMTRPYTLTDGCQLKIKKKSKASAIYTFSFIYLKLDQWTNGPIDQSTNGPMDKWANGQMDHFFQYIIEHSIQ